MGPPADKQADPIRKTGVKERERCILRRKHFLCQVFQFAFVGTAILLCVLQILECVFPNLTGFPACIKRSNRILAEILMRSAVRYHNLAICVWAAPASTPPFPISPSSVASGRLPPRLPWPLTPEHTSPVECGGLKLDFGRHWIKRLGSRANVC